MGLISQKTMAMTISPIRLYIPLVENGMAKRINPIIVMTADIIIIFALFNISFSRKRSRSNPRNVPLIRIMIIPYNC